VKAGNAHQVWSKSEALFPFSIAPSLYQRGWFQTACGLGVLGILASVYLWRVSALRRNQQAEKLAALAAERVRIAKDLHDGLGANLTRLSYLTDQAGETMSGVTPEHVHALSRSTREMASALRDIIWASNPSDETLAGLATRICQQAEELLSAAGIRCRFDLSAALPQAPLAGEFRRSLLLAAKEALNNVARHSSATEVWIQAQASDSTFQLSIEDNGIGFDATRPRAEGNGLVNMKSRIESVGGEFRIESKPGGGAKVAIRVGTKEAGNTL